jgi:putative ABC transport system permease protein
MPRALWTKAPLALLRHPVGLYAVVGVSLLMAVGAAAGPLLNAGVEGEALQRKLAEMTPLAAGLSIDRPPGRDSGGAPMIALRDRGRRRAAAALGLTLPSVGPPVLTTSMPSALIDPGFDLGSQVRVVPMARTNATAHVQRLAGDGSGVWLASSVLHRAGGIVAFSFPGAPTRKVSLPVGAVYRPLEDVPGNPYWVNFTARIRRTNPDLPPFPSFAFVSTAQLYRLASVAGGFVGNDFEFPLDARSMTPERAKRIARSFQHVKQRLAKRSGLAERLGCDDPSSPCTVSSELTAAVQIAAGGNSSLRPVIDLLAGFCVFVALGAALIAGAFTGRRRAAEARLSLARGEPQPLFLARAGIESFLPCLSGAAVGLFVALELVRLFTPDGSVDNSVVRQVVLRVAVSTVATVCAVALGVTIARGRLGDERRVWRLVARVPWEVVPVAAAGAAWVALDAGSGLVRDRVSGSHPRLIVLLLPALVAAALAGIVVRLLRTQVLRRVPLASVVGLLALRRVAAARGLLVALIVTIAAGTASLGFAEMLDASLTASTTEKAFASNGSDVQGLIDPRATIPPSFRYPATKVAEVYAAGRLDTGQTFELIAVDPATLRRVLARRCPKSVCSALRALASSDARLPAIAVGIDPGRHVVILSRSRSDVQVVARVRAFPGMQPMQPLLVVPVRALARPPTQALTYVWATGPPRKVAKALSHSILAPQYLTAAAQFSRNPDVRNITRTYGFLRVLAIGLVLLSLVALLLYLNARQRSQLVTSAFLRRMGLSQPRQAFSVALESTLLVALGTGVGVAAALMTAGAIVGRVDPLAVYSPPPALQVPWTALIASAAGVTFAAGTLGGALTMLLRRVAVGEDLRVS